MKKIGLIVNKIKDFDFEVTNTVLNWAKEKSIEILSMENLENENIKILNEQDFYKDSNIIVVIGGDGTVLTHAPKIAFYNKHMLGINCGTVGYLTSIDRDEIIEALNSAYEMKYKVSKHTLITSKLNNEKVNSLNEISIKSKNKIINLAVYIDGIYTHTFRSDGIIVSTPSGSTAYNLSSGGPLIMTNSEVLCITPVCPHQILAKPIIISDDSEVKIVYENKLNYEVEILSDGVNVKTLNEKFEIVIEKSDMLLKIINPFEKSFYQILLQKLIGVSDKQ